MENMSNKNLDSNVNKGYEQAENIDSNVLSKEIEPTKLKSGDDQSEIFIHKEGGFGWIVVLACSYSFGVLMSMINNYALIYNKMVIVYKTTENHVTYAAWIGSFSTGVQFLLCIFGSVLTDLYNPRNVGVVGGLISSFSLLGSAFIYDMKLYFLTYGVLFAIGQSFLLASTFAILPHYFNKKLAFVNGIMNLFGFAIVVCFSLALSSMLDKYDLNKTFYLLAGINFIAALMALTYIPQLTQIRKVNKLQRVKQSFALKVFKRRRFVVWCIASLIGMFGYVIPVVNIDHHSISAFPDTKPVIINIIFGAFSGASGIIFGLIGDRTKFNRVHYHTITFFIYGLVQVCIPFAKQFYVFAIQLGILGIMDGIFLSFIVPISYDLAESSSLANQANGYYHAAIAASVVAGPAVAGHIYEINQSYNNAFYVGGSVCLAASLILFAFILVPDLYAKRIRRELEQRRDQY